VQRCLSRGIGFPQGDFQEGFGAILSDVLGRDVLNGKFFDDFFTENAVIIIYI